MSEFGVVALIDSEFRGRGTARDRAAVESRETLFARDIMTSGYRLAIENRREQGTPSALGPKLGEFVSSPALALFGDNQQRRSLSLPIEETPEKAAEPATQWVNVWHHCLIDDPDDAAGIQRAIDSGARTLYFPPGGTFYVGTPVVLRGGLERIVGMYAPVQSIKADQPTFVTSAQSLAAVVLEGLTGNVRVKHGGPSTLVVRDCQGVDGEVTGGGKLHLENVVGVWSFGKGKSWCRQYNTERQGVHAVNSGGDLWILGLKTERGGTLIDTLVGGRTEVIGGLSYTTTEGKLAPMFVVNESSLSATIGEVCYTGYPYASLVRQTLGGVTRELKRTDAPLRPQFLQGSQPPLFVGRHRP